MALSLARSLQWSSPAQHVFRSCASLSPKNVSQIAVPFATQVLTAARESSGARRPAEPTRKKNVHKEAIQCEHAMPNVLKCQSCGRMFDAKQERPIEAARCPLCESRPNVPAGDGDKASLDEAIVERTEVIRLDPKSADAHHNRALSMRRRVIWTGQSATRPRPSASDPISLLHTLTEALPGTKRASWISLLPILQRPSGWTTTWRRLIRTEVWCFQDGESDPRPTLTLPGPRNSAKPSPICCRTPAGPSAAPTAR